jgi:hypothetical protein
MRTFTLTALVCLGLALQSLAQRAVSDIGRGRQCATDAYTEALKAKDPAFEERQRAWQLEVRQALAQQGQGKNLRADIVITIPVVFHVVYNDSSENISDEALLSQLEVLNADFRRMNADTASTPSYFKPFATDTRIQFCLASTDPNGDPTTGITRTRTTKKSFGYASDHV